MSPHRFLIASFLPILRAGLTASARFTFPIALRFNFDGFGSFEIHSGTGEPDCRRTFAMLFYRVFLEQYLEEKHLLTTSDMARPRR
jgi:hypothetical protein